MATIVEADIPTTIPTMAYTNAVFALFILSGLPAEIKYMIPDITIIIVPNVAINIPMPFAILVKSAQKLLTAPRGFGMVTADANVAAEIRHKLIEVYSTFLLTFIIDSLYQIN